MNNAPIGVFDSGVGGLTVAKEMIHRLPQESIIYFGDTARVPYGNKSKETVLRYARQIARFLLSHQVKAVVVACNTASAFALDSLQRELPVPVIGVVEPGARAAAEVSENKRIGIIGTEGTVRSGIYRDILQQLNPEIEVYQKACPLFVPLAEEGWISDDITALVAKRYLQPLCDAGVDTLILGCTHYPLMYRVIQETMSDKVKLVNPAYETANYLAKVLENHHLLHDASPDTHHFYVSDGAERFREFAKSILPYKMTEVGDVSIKTFE